jgi:hypothetical protein
MDIIRGILPNRSVVTHYEFKVWSGFAPSLGFEYHNHAVLGGIYSDSLPHLLNLYRDLGEALELCQPGITKPLPDNSPDMVDAMKIQYEADRLRRESK